MYLEAKVRPFTKWLPFWLQNVAFWSERKISKITPIYLCQQQTNYDTNYDCVFTAFMSQTHIPEFYLHCEIYQGHVKPHGHRIENVLFCQLANLINNENFENIEKLWPPMRALQSHKFIGFPLKPAACIGPPAFSWLVRP